MQLPFSLRSLQELVVGQQLWEPGASQGLHRSPQEYMACHAKKQTPIPDSFTSLRSSKVIASPLPPHSSHSWQRTRGGLSCAALCALRISSMVLEVPLDFLHWQCVVRGLLQSYGECSLVGPFGMKWKNYFALEISVYL